jgi:hypothetical protein
VTLEVDSESQGQDSILVIFRVMSRVLDMHGPDQAVHIRDLGIPSAALLERVCTRTTTTVECGDLCYTKFKPPRLMFLLTSRSLRTT